MPRLINPVNRNQRGRRGEGAMGMRLFIAPKGGESAARHETRSPYSVHTGGPPARTNHPAQVGRA